MKPTDETAKIPWGWGCAIASLVFIAGSLAIAEIGDRITPRKEIFYCWLLVFFNAYIGTFIANKAIKSDFTGFMVWAFLVNGLRSGVFLVSLLLIVKWDVVNVQGFVLMTFLGYFAFLSVEIHGLQKHTKRKTRTTLRGDKDD